MDVLFEPLRFSCAGSPRSIHTLEGPSSSFFFSIFLLLILGGAASQNPCSKEDESMMDGLAVVNEQRWSGRGGRGGLQKGHRASSVVYHQPERKKQGGGRWEESGVVALLWSFLCKLVFVLLLGLSGDARLVYLLALHATYCIKRGSTVMLASPGRCDGAGGFEQVHYLGIY